MLRDCLHIGRVTKQHHQVPLQVYNVLDVCEFCVCGNNSHSNVCTFFNLSIFKYMRDENKSSTNKWKNWNQEKPSYNKTTKVTTLNLRLSVLNLKTIDFSSRIILLVGLSCELSVMPLTPLLPGMTEENVIDIAKDSLGCKTVLGWEPVLDLYIWKSLLGYYFSLPIYTCFSFLHLNSSSFKYLCKSPIQSINQQKQ